MQSISGKLGGSPPPEDPPPPPALLAPAGEEVVVVDQQQNGKAQDSDREGSPQEVGESVSAQEAAVVEVASS